jgi:myo-inositol-1(or 4)-monophosphatase
LTIDNDIPPAFIFDKQTTRKMIFPEKIIKKSLKEAAEILMSHFGKRIDEELKENQSSIVTEMDVAAERKIEHIISSKYPNHSIVGEETGAVMTGSEFTWIIDPIDGTSNYAAGIPWFGTLVAVLQHDKPYAAGAYLPCYDLLYYAEEGKGATCNGETIHVTSESSLKNVLFAYATDFSDDQQKTRYEMDLLFEIIRNVRNIRGTNCLVDFCYVADGRLGGYINHSCKIWDIVAPGLIIQEAGGIMTHLDGSNLDFDLSIDNYLRNYKIIATANHLHKPIMKIVDKSFNP